MRKICFITARLSGKPLLKTDDIAVISIVYLQVKKCKLIDDIVVLTDDERVKDEIEKIGGNVAVISVECLNDTELIIRYLEKNSNICDIVISVPGDEPFVNPNHIDLCIRNYYKEKYNIEFNVLDTKFTNKENMKCSTLCHVLDKDEVENRNICKLVVNKNGDIMYCSRNVIPGGKHSVINPNTAYYGHIGVFVFDKDYLLNEYIKENTLYQLNEDIELLKIIEQGYTVNVIKVELG